MPGFKPIGYVVPALLAVAGTYATPFQKRGLDEVISQCNHHVAYASSLFPINHFHCYTFDGGPSSSNTDFVNKFDHAGGQTTFFVNGKAKGNDSSCIYSEENVKAMRYGYEHDHQYASNTWSNADLTTLTKAQIDEEILRLDEAFVKILGVKPKFLRPPNGSINDQTASYIQAKHNKTIVIWNLDPGDPQSWPEMFDYNKYFRSLTTSNRAANMSFITRANELNPYIRDTAIADILRSAGVTLHTVAGCLDRQAYEFVGKYGERDNTWTCNGTWTPSAPTTPAPTTPASTPARTVPSTRPAPPISSSLPPTMTASCGTPDEVCEQPSPSSVPFTTATRSSASTHSVPSISSRAPSTKTAPSRVPPTTVTSSSAPPIKATHSSVPDGPNEPSCMTQDYQSLEGETCSSIETKFALQMGSVSAANTFVDCSDIWANTNLSICVPTSDPHQYCTKHERVDRATTCAAVGEANGVCAAWIKAWNSWINCDDIWQGTDLCIAQGRGDSPPI